MKFLVYAQLPIRLARLLERRGHDVRHTSELADGNRTTDADIIVVADAEGRVVVTKDRDFRDQHLLRGTPRRLLIIATGNISNHDLFALFDAHLDTITDALEEARFVELGPTGLIVHEDRT